KAWDGVFYSKNNLSIVAHLPTRSEFYIRVMQAARDGSGITNVTGRIINEIAESSGAKASNEGFQSLRHRIAMADGTETEKDIVYTLTHLRGHRFDTDRYRKEDRVHTTLYVACLTCDKDRPDEGLYMIAVAMVPLDVPQREDERLVGVMRTF